MGQLDRDWYWEDKERRDALPHVTASSQAQSQVEQKPAQWPIEVEKPSNKITALHVIVWLALMALAVWLLPLLR